MRINSVRRGRVRLALVLWVLPVMVAADASLFTGQVASPKSVELVKQLTDVMSQRGLTAIAARQPPDADRYVAAMLFPGVQLLVISARSSSPAYIDSQLAARGYSEIYTSLHQGIDDSKLFIQDMGGDGLRGSHGGTADLVYRKGREQTILGGDHEAAKMSEAEYRRMADQTEREYVALLTLLLDAARAGDVAQMAK